MGEVLPGELSAGIPRELAQLVEKARREWLAARNAFDFVTEPELVDHAIFAMQAAERRYVYLLKLAARTCADRTAAEPAAGSVPAARPPTANRPACPPARPAS